MEYKYAKAPKRRRARPEKWVHGPDKVTHEKYYAYLKHKAQAKFRKEEYELTPEQWFNIWNDDDVFFKRGRSRNCVVLTRKDVEGSWSVDNCEIITRYEQLLRDIQLKANARWPKD